LVLFKNLIPKTTSDHDAHTKLATRQDIHINLRLVPKTTATSSLSAINTQLSREYLGK